MQEDKVIVLGGLTIAEKRKVKGKEEQKRYTKLNAELQRISKRDKDFLSKQCKEIEENNRDLFKKTGDIKGAFHARIGIIKDRNNKDLKESEEIKKKSQEHREEPYKKGLNDPDNHSGVVSYLEPNILECEVKLAL